MSGEGVLCRNYLSSRGDWTAFQKVWCSPCYKPLDNGEFPAAKALDEGGMDTDCAEDQDCFRRGSNGDNLAMHFQCNLCPFQNLMKPDPVKNLPQDVRLLKLIHQANLDMLWSQELTTVATALNLCQSRVTIEKSMGFGIFSLP